MSSPPTQFVSALEFATYTNGTTDLADLDPAWIAQANILLQMISADIEAAAGIPIDVGTGTVLIPGTWSRDLPLAGPVRNITAVAVNGLPQAPANYVWNQRQILRRGSAYLDETVDFEDDWHRFGQQGATYRTGGHWGGPTSTVAISYSWGYVEVPTVLRSLVFRIASRTFGNLAQVTQESLAIYSVSYGASSNVNDGSHVTAAERKRLRQMFNVRAGTFDVRGR